MGKFIKKVKKNSKKSMMAYEKKTAVCHKAGGTVVNLVDYDIDIIKKDHDRLLLEDSNYKEHTPGTCLAAFAQGLWNSACETSKDTLKNGEWVIFHIGKANFGPVFRLAGYYGDKFADETEFDAPVLSEWGYTLADILEATTASAKFAEYQKAMKVSA